MDIDLSKIAVTLWLFFGTLAITTVMYFLAGDLTPAGEPKSMAFWLDTSVTASGVGALAGFVADVIRFAATAVWPEKMPYRIKLNKLLNQHLIGH